MKCREFAEVVHELVRREQLGPAVAAIARAHAEACPPCGCRLAEAERLAALIQAASAENRHLSAPSRLEAELLGAFRREHALRHNAPVRRRLGWYAVLGWAGVGAALALLTFVLVYRAPDHRSSPVVGPSAEASASTTRAPRQAAQARRPPVRTAPVQASETALASEFVPVPYSGGFAPGDSAVIVRVQVPRTALAELGYPVDESQGNGVVQADLLVGEDGWPHAVRIVR